MGQIPHCLTRWVWCFFSGCIWARQCTILHRGGKRRVQSCYWFCIRSPKWLDHTPFSWICRTWGVNSNATRIPSQLLLLNCRTSWMTTTSFKALQQKAWNSLCDLNTIHQTALGVSYQAIPTMTRCGHLILWWELSFHLRPREKGRKGQLWRKQRNGTGERNQGTNLKYRVKKL